MNHRLVSLSTLTGLMVATIAPAIAQDSPCYYVNTAGQVINLTKLCSGGSGSAGGTMAPGRSDPANKSMFRAKIKRRAGRTPVIDVRINGRHTFEMIVDTGADGSLITRSMANAMKVPVVGTVRASVADGRVVSLPLGRLQSLTVDGATIQNVDVAIADDNGPGLLGHDFFGNYDVKIKQDVVEFYRR